MADMQPAALPGPTEILPSAPVTTPPDVPLGRLAVDIQAPVMLAGLPETIRLVIRNPFNCPIEIVSVKGPGYFESRDDSTIRVPSASHNLTEDGTVKTVRHERKTLGSRLRSVFGGDLRVSEVSLGLFTARFPAAQDPRIDITAAGQSKVIWERPLPEDRRVRVTVDDTAEVRFAAEPLVAEQSSPPERQILAPGSEAVAAFGFVTRNWLFFRPAATTLSAQIDYIANGTLRSQVVPIPLVMRAQVKAIVIGALVGSLLGYLARQVKDGTLTSSNGVARLLVGLGGSLVAATIATIAFARKEATQGFITVEDFYGGFLIGALVGYTGLQVLDKALEGASPPAHPGVGVAK